MSKNQSFRKKGFVSLWLGVRKPDLAAMDGVDILKDKCGVSYYDVDDQEVAAIDDNYPKAPIADVLQQLSYSSSFLAAASKQAGEKKIRHAYWALAQYDFAYNPARISKPIAPEPLFLGVFEWNDSEDDLEEMYG
jgi:hypothetical protein